MLSYGHQDLLSEFVGPIVQKGEWSGGCVGIVLQSAHGRGRAGGVSRSVARQHVQHGDVRSCWKGILFNAKARARKVVAQLALEMVDISAGWCTSNGYLRLERCRRDVRDGGERRRVRLSEEGRDTCRRRTSIELWSGLKVPEPY